jgi:hypothetical protein
MPLRIGEIIEVVKRGPAGGWCKGKNGAFPTDYVEFISTAANPSNVPSLVTASSANSANMLLGQTPSLTGSISAGSMNNITLQPTKQPSYNNAAGASVDLLGLDVPSSSKVSNRYYFILVDYDSLAEPRLFKY